MKLFQVCALALLIAVASGVALADTINDPKVIVHGVAGGNAPCGSHGSHNCVGVGVNFSFSVPKSGSGVLYFTNDSGKNWNSLALIETGVPAANISCVQSFYLSCTAKTLKNGSTEILLSGIRGGENPQTGIGPGQSFSIQFACVHKDCWPGGLQIQGHATTATPEPMTLGLMLTGLGGVYLRRRKVWKNRFNG